MEVFFPFKKKVYQIPSAGQTYSSVQANKHDLYSETNKQGCTIGTVLKLARARAASHAGHQATKQTPTSPKSWPGFLEFSVMLTETSVALAIGSCWAIPAPCFGEWQRHGRRCHDHGNSTGHHCW
jgi:hypothetical protein